MCLMPDDCETVSAVLLCGSLSYIGAAVCVYFVNVIEMHLE